MGLQVQTEKRVEPAVTVKAAPEALLDIGRILLLVTPQRYAAFL